MVLSIPKILRQSAGHAQRSPEMVGACNLLVNARSTFFYILQTEYGENWERSRVPFSTAMDDDHSGLDVSENKDDDSAAASDVIAMMTGK